MSTDYSTGGTALRVRVPAGFVSGANLVGKLIPASYIFAHYDYLALALILHADGGAQSGTQQTVKLQASDETGGDSGVWTDLTSITFDPDNQVPGCVYHSRVPENLAFISVSRNGFGGAGFPLVSPGTPSRRRVLQLIHVSSAASAVLSYTAEVITTSRHE